MFNAQYSMLNVQFNGLSSLKKLLIINYSLLILTGCSVQQKISKSAKQIVLNDSSLLNAHVGISIYEPATGKYLYNYQGDKYFVPASNTKIPTCYAAMKYLGDSLVGLRYGIPEEKWFNESAVVIDVTGDPTFLHEDFKQSPVFDFLKGQLLGSKKQLGLLIKDNDFKAWGNGWSWNDYQEPYMAERSSFPIFGNVVTVRLLDSLFLVSNSPLTYKYRLFKTNNSYFD